MRLSPLAAAALAEATRLRLAQLPTPPLLVLPLRLQVLLWSLMALVLSLVAGQQISPVPSARAFNLCL